MSCFYLSRRRCLLNSARRLRPALVAATVSFVASVAALPQCTPGGVTTVTSTSYTFLSTDCGKLVTFSNLGAITSALPAPGSSYFVDVQNTGIGLLTVNPPTGVTIDGASALTVSTAEGLRIFSNSTSYFTQRGLQDATTVTYTGLPEGTTSGPDAMHVIVDDNVQPLNPFAASALPGGPPPLTFASYTNANGPIHAGTCPTLRPSFPWRPALLTTFECCSRGAILKEEVWQDERGNIVRYSPAYLNPRLCFSAK
jgi:hypothetical protein